jgi:hypothetical protein
MNTKEIIRKYLQDNGFDGLWNQDDECGCEITDLCPCGNSFEFCEPGYKRPGEIGEDFDFTVGPDKMEK